MNVKGFPSEPQPIGLKAVQTARTAPGTSTRPGRGADNDNMNAQESVRRGRRGRRRRVSNVEGTSHVAGRKEPCSRKMKGRSHSGTRTETMYPYKFLNASRFHSCLDYYARMTRLLGHINRDTNKAGSQPGECNRGRVNNAACEQPSNTQTRYGIARLHAGPGMPGIPRGQG